MTTARMTRKPKQGLTFSPGNHQYRLDGQIVPGVTTIIGVLDKSGPLTKWAAKTVAEYVADNPAGVDALRDMGREPMVAALKEVPFQKRDAAAERGHKFHWYAEQILLGNEVDVPEEHVPLVEQCLRFADDWNVEPIVVEQAVGSREHRYAGTVDLVADVRRPGSTGVRERAILDWKSGRKVYASTCMQMVGYANAEFYGLNGDEHPMADLNITAAYGIHVRADGYDVYPLRFTPGLFAEFLTIRAAYDINKRAEGDWKVPGSGYVGRAIQPEPEGVFS